MHGEDNTELETYCGLGVGFEGIYGGSWKVGESPALLIRVVPDVGI